MDLLDALDRSEDEFLARADQLTGDHWSQPTICGDWVVADLVRHVVGGSFMAVPGLAGAPKEELVAVLQGPVDGGLLEALRAACAAQSEAARAPGAFDATVHHPTIDMTGEQFLGFRTVDMAMHAWDLSRSLGFDETLDDEMVAWTWEFLQPIAPFIGSIGIFGEGPSGTLTDADPLSARLLDLTGRRP
jgi:uncharacterized protein (TIGR03086 family)